MFTVDRNQTATNQKTYRSPFSKWNNSSWIRTKPIRSTKEISGLPFSPDLVPLASHSAIIASDSQKWTKVLAYRLLAHLQFTTLLELSHVNPVCSLLAQGQAPISMNIEQKHDALKIYCDEGGHALFVELFSKEVQESFGLNRSVVGRPQFDRTLERIIRENQTRLSPNLMKLFFVTISETLVTKILNNVPHDPAVADVVRDVIGDHAADEALHSAYFRKLFPLLWNNLTAYEQEEMGQILPQFVWAFLGPDRQFEYSVLRSMGFNAKDAEGILEEVYVPAKIAQEVKQAAKPTLKMFESAGVFSLPIIEQFFADSELI